VNNSESRMIRDCFVVCFDRILSLRYSFGDIKQNQSRKAMFDLCTRMKNVTDASIMAIIQLVTVNTERGNREIYSSRHECHLSDKPCTKASAITGMARHCRRRSILSLGPLLLLVFAIRFHCYSCCGRQILDVIRA
jgi:hypothetical protein